MELKDRIRRRLASIEADGRTRKLAEPEGIDLSSNNYLCLAADDRVTSAMIEGVGKYGAGATASRLLRGHRDIFGQAEEEFAAFKRTDRSLYFATGYQTNLGIFQTFLEEGDVVFSDELNHASLIDGMRLAKAEKVLFRHADSADLLSKIAANDVRRKRFLVTESLFSMDGDFAPLEEYADICRKHGIELIVDEAHAVGIYGERGSGLIEETGIDEAVFLSINTAGKALGVSGAFVAGPEWAIEYLVQACRSFIFSTAPPPSLAQALIESIRIVEDSNELRMALRSRSASFRRSLRDRGFDVAEGDSQIIPVVIGESEKAVRIAEQIRQLGFDVRAIRPPTVPAGTSRLRISLNTGVDDKTLESFADALDEAIQGETSAAAKYP